MELKQKPSLITGAIVGALITAPFIAISFLADRLASLPFFPFDLFDWIGRVAPGEVITAGIDTIVDAVNTFELGETSAAAKNVEQVVAILTMFGIGVAISALFFVLVNRASTKTNNYILGGAIGGILGLLMILIFNRVNLTATADDTLSQIWIVLAFTVWGVALGWIYNDLNDFQPTEKEIEKAKNDSALTATGYQLDRRKFLINVGGATATLTVAGAGLSLLLGDNDDNAVSTSIIIPESTPDPSAQTASADIVQPAPGTRPEYTPLDNHYRIDISTRPPIIEEEGWTLNITGSVAAPLMMTLAQLVEDYEPVNQLVTLSCISNRIGGSLISTTRWTGVQLNQLIEEWDLDPEATHLRISSADGFDEYVALDLIREDDRIMLAYAWDGEPLRRQHGFPLRIYIPDHYGMKQPKWITDIEVVNSWSEGYWVRRGWSSTAIVNTTSVIDTVATDSIILRGENLFVPIGGIAYSGAKQISRVEVQVDEGEWQEAQLREALSETTWRLWRYDWAFEEGQHTFRVRTYDGEGVLQSIEDRGTRPDGATGIHDEDRNISAPVMPTESTPEAEVTPDA